VCVCPIQHRVSVFYYTLSIAAGVKERRSSLSEILIPGPLLYQGAAQSWEKIWGGMAGARTASSPWSARVRAAAMSGAGSSNMTSARGCLPGLGANMGHMLSHTLVSHAHYSPLPWHPPAGPAARRPSGVSRSYGPTTAGCARTWAAWRTPPG